MLKIQANSRQIPNVEKYTADKKYNDLLYGVLQEISVLDGQYRYVNKNDVNFTQLGRKIGVTRQTASSKFKNLIALGLIEYKEGENRYQLNYLDKTLCSLVPFETLRKINNSLSQNAISTFVLLLKRYIANGEKEFIVTIFQIKKFIGIATSTTSNNEIVTDILEVLSLLKLIQYEVIMTEKDKSNIIIKRVNNVIK